MNVRYESVFFKVFELYEGVFSAVDNGGDNSSGSNSGIIDLGGASVIFDTMMDYDAACDLKNACMELTGRAPDYVVNSHSHLDHIVGNSIFKADGAILISSDDVRKTIITAKSEIEKEKESYGDQIIEIEEAVKNENDHTKKDELNRTLAYLKNLYRPEVCICSSDLTFDEHIALHGDKRDILLHHMGTAHSPGDVIAYLPDCKVLFTGDIFFAGGHPWIGSGSPDRLADVLDKILKWEVEYYVPGHGLCSSAGEVGLLIQYIKEMAELVKNKGSLNAGDYSTSELSPVFAGWKQDRTFKRNIAFLIDRLLKGSREN